MTAEPSAYQIGWVPFLDTKIFLDSRPLIPRTETEYWVEQALSSLEKTRALHILDLFAGSGCIGIALLAHLPQAHVDFAEIDERHFPTIEKNISENGISTERVSLIRTDVWSAITGTYDSVFANPPYLSKNRIERVQDSVLAFEPEEALFAEEDGFALIRRTLEGLLPHLNPGGALYIEHEPEHSVPIKSLASLLDLKAEVRKDQYGVLRYSRISTE